MITGTYASGLEVVEDVSQNWVVFGYSPEANDPTAPAVVRCLDLPIEIFPKNNERVSLINIFLIGLLLAIIYRIV